MQMTWKRVLTNKIVLGEELKVLFCLITFACGRHGRFKGGVEFTNEKNLAMLIHMQGNSHTWNENESWNFSIETIGHSDLMQS